MENIKRFNITQYIKLNEVNRRVFKAVILFVIRLVDNNN